MVITLNALPSIPGPPLSYTVPVDTSSIVTSSPTVVTRFRRVVPGTYLIRIQVDGASSALTVDSSTGLFDGPTVEVTSP